MPTPSADTAGDRTGPEVPDLVELEVDAETRVLVVSDVHLPGEQTEASSWAQPELVRLLDEWEGPGVLVLAGDLLELWAGEHPDATASLDAHAELARAVHAFADSGRRVFYLPGNHDGRLGWDAGTIAVAQERLAAEVSFAVELSAASWDGPRTVRIEHGHRYDPANDFKDPRSPEDTPLGQHVVQEILPSLAPPEGSWMDGVESLADPRTFTAFITSRVFYRKLAKQSLWLLLPLLLAMVLRFPITYAALRGQDSPLNTFEARLVLLDVAILADIALVAGILLLGARKAWTAASAVAAQKRGKAQNDNARAAARELISKGFAGMVSGHTHHPELSAVGEGFYANTGSCTKVVERADAHFGLPHVFVPRIRVCWVELIAEPPGATAPWRVNLTAGERQLEGSTWLERKVEKRASALAPELAVVGEYPAPR